MISAFGGVIMVLFFVYRWSAMNFDYNVVVFATDNIVGSG